MKNTIPKKIPLLFSRPKNIPFGQNVRPKKNPSNPPSLKYVVRAPGVGFPPASQNDSFQQNSKFLWIINTLGVHSKVRVSCGNAWLQNRLNIVTNLAAGLLGPFLESDKYILYSPLLAVNFVKHPDLGAT